MLDVGITKKVNTVLNYWAPLIQSTCNLATLISALISKDTKYSNNISMTFAPANEKDAATTELLRVGLQYL